MKPFVAACLILMSAASARADVLDRIAESGVIRFGVREASAPFSYLDGEGAARGLAIRLCGRVAETLAARLGNDELAIEYAPVTSENRFAALAEDRIDILCGPTTQTLARREAMDFSIPYFMDGVGAALRRDGVQDLADLTGEPIGALAGTTAVGIARAWGDPGGSPLREFASHEAGLRALGLGEIDAYFGDHGLLSYRLAALKAEDRLIPIRVLPDQFSYEPYSLAMKGGERRLRLEVDRALSAAYLSQAVFDDIEAEFGAFEMSDLAAFLYVLVALPE